MSRTSCVLGWVSLEEAHIGDRFDQARLIRHNAILARCVSSSIVFDPPLTAHLPAETESILQVSFHVYHSAALCRH